MLNAVVVMGVAGSGKSTLGAALARTHGVPLVEGDEFHSDRSRDKMRRGIPLDDADRDGWLDTLSAQLRDHPEGVILTCSALKRTYRDRLRAAQPGLRFVFMEIDLAAAQARVRQRGASHFFSPRLVASQFATLEPPLAEDLVLRVDALAPLASLEARVSSWLREAAPR